MKVKLRFFTRADNRQETVSAPKPKRKPSTGLAWTPAMEARLVELFDVHTCRQIAEIMGLRRQQVKNKLGSLGITRGRRSLFWTEAREAELTALYPDITNAEIAERLGTTETNVSQKAHKMRLRKSEAFRRFHAEKGMFKPGIIPHNKGKDCRHYVTEKSRATQFKKGQASSNELYDGAITQRKDKNGHFYTYIRKAKGQWEYLARHVWAQHHGPIPKGMIIRHINGDTLDDRLENLEMISRKENQHRNSGSVNLSDGYVAMTLATKKNPELTQVYKQHPQLLELKREQMKLNRLLKSSQDDNARNDCTP